MPRPSRERSSDVSTCVNISKMRKLLGGDADAGVLNPDDRLLALALGSQPNAAAFVGELAGVVQQVPTT